MSVPVAIGDRALTLRAGAHERAALTAVRFERMAKRFTLALRWMHLVAVPDAEHASAFTDSSGASANDFSDGFGRVLAPQFAECCIC